MSWVLGVGAVVLAGLALVALADYVWDVLHEEDS